MSFEVTDKTKNFGPARAGASTTRYYLSSVRHRTAAAFRLKGSRPVDALKSGESSRGSKTVKVPGSTSPASYFLLACADDRHDVRESKEANNCRASSTKVSVRLGLTIGPTAHDFGSVASGSSSEPFSFTVRNTGGVPSGTISPSLAGSAAFKVVAGGCAGQPLAPGASCTITVRFNPTSAGAKSGTLNVSATPGGTASAKLSGTGTPLSMSPTEHDYGPVASGSSSEPFSFTVRNTGGAATGTISPSLVGSADFVLVTNGCTGTLAPGASCTITVRFNPTSAGAKSGTLTVTGSPGGSASASLSGTGTPLSIDPTAHDYGSVGSGTPSSPFTFTIHNTGGVASGALSASVVGSPDFVLGTNTCDGVVLGPSESCTVDVSFAPSSGGAKSGTLNVSASPGGTVAAALSGSS